MSKIITVIADEGFPIFYAREYRDDYDVDMADGIIQVDDETWERWEKVRKDFWALNDEIGEAIKWRQ